MAQSAQLFLSWGQGDLFDIKSSLWYNKQHINSPLVKKPQTMLSFSPKNLTKDLLAELPERSRRVLSDRFGLSGKGESRTLDAIGREYGITRERIRQIENHGLMSVRESRAYESHAQHLEDLRKTRFTSSAALSLSTSRWMNFPKQRLSAIIFYFFSRSDTNSKIAARVQTFIRVGIPMLD
jgi:hypothetical protein